MTDRNRKPRVTLKMVASAAGVSPTLASFALNDKAGVSARNRAEILRIAGELGYQPDPLARELRTGKAQMFGFIVRNFANPFFNDVLTGMQEAAVQDDITIIAMDSHYSQDREVSHIRKLSSRRITNLAIAPVGAAESVLPWSESTAQSRLVLVNSSIESAANVAHVSPDAVSAVTQAFEHLREFGHERIAFLSAPPGIMSDADRYFAYEELCRTHGVVPRAIFTPLEAGGIAHNIEQALSRPEPPTAIITNSDFSAQYVYVVARKLGLVLGRDLSLVGHDDLDTSRLFDPPMTTLRVDRRQLGREIYARLTGTTTADHREPVQLIVRATTGPPPP
ncbi:LacI family DNA-binding transcriptional regulator [Arthrobacter agilis]|uniref:LacI family DNA-binding transcriptional regulator n=1 Tax=Arthrobacter agilis TaxID=37921 RepID=UPI002788AACA|nr:LacI family DNA-binding transcriptional regulator [Arthrobacter agilis]MDQ0736424.1 DNA-binding LacI/PurR family transcriptional regulator [Arthrobacter agilis]